MSKNIDLDLKTNETKQDVYVDVLKLKYIGEEDFIIRTRTNRAYVLKKNDYAFFPNNAYGKAYERMKVFIKA